MTQAERLEFLGRVEREDPEAAAELKSLIEFASDGDDRQWVGARVFSADDHVAPKTIGPYSVERLIGHGGMGRVYAAHQTTPIARAVAINVIKPGMDSTEVLRRFRNERRTLERLDHPGICRALDAGLDDRQRPYIVLERIDGPTITEYARIHELDVPGKLALLQQVCDAVAHANLRGLVHRDLKPSNVLVVDEGGAPRAKVIDFGMATLLERDSSEEGSFEVSEISRGRPIGTLEYMSPEQAAGGEVDERSDVYSLGVLLYVLLAGVLPNDSRELRALAPTDLGRYLRDREIIPPRDRIRSGASGSSAYRARELDWVAAKALEGEKERRYQTVGELGDDIRRYLRGDVVRAVPASRAYLLRKAMRRHRLSMTICVAAIAVGTVIAATSFTAYQRVEAARVSAETALGDTVQAAEYLGGLLESTGPFGLGRDATVRDLLDEATARIDLRLAAAPLVRARVRPHLARAHLELGRVDVAGEQLQLARQESQALLAEDPAGRARLHLDFAHFHELSNDLASMREEALAAVKAFEEDATPPSELTLKARAYVGLSGYRSADHDVAVPELRSAAAYALRHGLQQTPTGIRTRVWLAGALQWSGEKDEPLVMLQELSQEVTALEQRLGDDTYWEVAARVRRELGALHLNRNEPDLAVPLLDRVVASFDERLGPHDRATLAVRADRAIARSFLGDHGGAIEDFTVLVDANTKSRGPSAPRTLALRANLVSIQLMAKRMEDALRGADELLEDLDPSEPAHTMTVAQTLGVRGAVKLALEDAPGALRDLTEARRLMKASGGEHLPVFGAIGRDLARALEAVGRGDEAEELRREMKQ